ncbi:class I SAM-dependent methyltransferase [Parabacteroides bouchesdurhonensis]|uniref:class I SAM-dependent methyltransferase n=1 Tax=Parabacteroides bouchesdurhonensis TaxID=1936995 RepID=UPI000E5244C3|nr:class I SAM-dependent methyltransferase [Parabacteroides bouchesdurhonensis]RHJ95218.1 SAM-dependent methyltransferase [Bacteroides sp. AM07-16]
MMLSEEQKRFICEHAADDLSCLFLSASKYAVPDVPFLIEQIASRKQIREKLPSWYLNQDLLFPAKIAAEQCSSELTASYKQALVNADDHLCDLTGGLGIDSYFFSRKVKGVTYIERYAPYCEVAKHNFGILGADNITVINADITEFRSQLPKVDVFYIDPARRGEGNKRVFALQDCEPDLPDLLPVLFERAPKVIAKVSPMADIQQTLDLLPGTTEVHVLSVKNECKELLFVIEGDKTVLSPQLHCINFTVDGRKELYSFTLPEEREASLCLSDKVDSYMYEPNASLLKAGAFKSTALRFGLRKLHVSSHLYTSSELVSGFPGRIFSVEEVYPFSGKLCKQLSKQVPRANITVRNFPLSVDELRKRTKIADGGNVYLFATTLAGGEKVLVKGIKI